MNKSTDTPRTDEEMWTTDYHHELCNVVNTEFAQQLEMELTEKTNEVSRLRKLMRNYIDFIDENMGTTADWPMEAAFDDETTAQRHCDLLNAMKREVKPEDIKIGVS